MKVRHHIATISFCRNLTVANSEVVPVGVLMVGELPSGHAMDLLVVREDPALLASLPPLIRAIVADFPHLIQAQLTEILERDGDTSIDTVMTEFEESLRNSFFVSELLWNQELEVPESAPVASPSEPWRAAYPSVVAKASERMVAFNPTPDHVRQSFIPWIHRSTAGSLGHAATITA